MEVTLCSAMPVFYHSIATEQTTVAKKAGLSTLLLPAFLVGEASSKQGVELHCKFFLALYEFDAVNERWLLELA